LTLGTNSNFKLYDQSWTGFHTGVCKDCNYDGHLQESAW